MQPLRPLAALAGWHGLLISPRVQHIVPELQRTAAEDDTGAAVLKADAIKFLTTFRGQVPKATCMQLLPSLVQALGSPSNVVHSYAAICIERLLASKVSSPPVRRARRSSCCTTMQACLLAGRHACGPWLGS